MSYNPIYPLTGRFFFKRNIFGQQVLYVEEIRNADRWRTGTYKVRKAKQEDIVKLFHSEHKYTAPQYNPPKK